MSQVGRYTKFLIITGADQRFNFNQIVFLLEGTISKTISSCSESYEYAKADIQICISKGCDKIATTCKYISETK